MFRRSIIFCLCGLLVISFSTPLFAQASAPEKQAPAAAAPAKQPAEMAAPEKKPGIPEDPKKHTTLGLYVTSKEAYDMWQNDKDKIKILDCRTPEEYAFVGHAPMAVNIPTQFMKYSWDPEKKNYVMRDNAKFARQAKKILKRTDTILVMCRSGHRSAKTVEKLAKAGFKNVYNVTDGFEGDKVNDPQSPNHGKRMKNGWKNSGVPWTYDLDPELIYLPGGPPAKK